MTTPQILALLLLGAAIGISLVRLGGKRDATSYANMIFCASMLGLLWWGGFFA